MNPNLQADACDPDRLEAFLSGDSSHAEERELAQHLNTCENCRRALERQAAEPEGWREAEKLLAPLPLDWQNGDAASVPSQRTARQPLEIDAVLGALGPTDDPQMLGRLAGYEVSGVVGAGGMGVVLKAIDRPLDRTVAIKVLSPHLAASGAARRRFAREAKAAAAVLHPNVIAIHSVSNDEALPYLVMPYLRGTSLQKRLEGEGPLPLTEILRIGSQIAAGLAAAHAQGLVHRDIKPANILLEEGVERVAITDFGLARAVDDATLTRSGVVAGTPQYMSPEQARGEPLDGRSDLFSLGSVLYEMATGVSPFRADSTMATLRRVIDVSPAAIGSLNPELPTWFVGIVERLLEKGPTKRFGSAKEVGELLEGCIAHLQQPMHVPLPAGLPAQARWRGWRPSLARPRGKVALIAAFGMVALGVLLFADVPGRWFGAVPPQDGQVDNDAARSSVPKSAHIGGKIGSVMVVHDEVDPHYVFYHAGAFETASRSSHNTRTLAWRDEGTITFDGGKTFGYDRESSDPFHVRVNGKEYDLRQGRVLELLGDGSVEQLKLFPSLPTAKAPEDLATLVSSARWMNSEPNSLAKLQLQLDAAEAQLRDLLKAHAPTHALVADVRGSIVKLQKRVEVAEGASGSTTDRPAPEGPAALAEPTPEQRAAMQRGVEFLVQSQQEDGSFSAPNSNDAYTVGVSGLCTLALLRSGLAADEPRVAQALDFLRMQEPKLTYELAVQALALCAAGAKADLPQIQRIVEILEDSQLADEPSSGGWTYSANIPSRTGDSSNSEFAVWALDEAARRGARVRPRTWHAAADYWRDRQCDDGGWLYSGPASDAVTTGGMTCAGAVSLAICSARLRGKGFAGEADDKQQVDRALVRLDVIFSSDQNPRDTRWFFCYAVALRRVAEVSDRKRFAGHDWRNLVSAELLKRQDQATGAFHERDRSRGLVDTSMALWFLGTAPKRPHKAAPEANENQPRNSAAEPPPKAAATAPTVSRRLQTADRVKCVACSADGKLIAIANGSPTFPLKKGWKRSVEILDGQTGESIVSLELSDEDERAVLAKTEGLPHFEVTALAFSSDGSVLAVGTGIGQVKLFNPQTGEVVKSLDDEEAKLAELKTPKILKSLDRAMGGVASLAFAPDGSFLATSGSSFEDVARNWGGIERLGHLATGPGRLKVWEVETGALQHDLAGHSHVDAIAFSPDGFMLASAGRWSGPDHGTGAIVWDLETGEKLRTLPNEANGGTHAVAFSPNGKLLAIGSRIFDKDSDTSKTTIRLVHARTGIMEWAQTIPGWANPKAFSPDEKSIVVLCGGQSIRFLDVETGTSRHEIKAADNLQGARWTDFAIAPKSGHLVIGGASGEHKGIVEIWELSSAGPADDSLPADRK